MKVNLDKLKLRNGIQDKYKQDEGIYLKIIEGYDYITEHSQVFSCRVRYQNESKQKTIIPYYFDGKTWLLGYPNKDVLYPMFHLQTILNKPLNLPVFVLDGEKDVCNAYQSFGYNKALFTCFKLGVNKTDITALKHRLVIVLPDNDGKTGKLQAIQIAKKLEEKNIVYKIVKPEILNKNKDLSNFIESGKTLDDLFTLVGYQNKTFSNCYNSYQELDEKLKKEEFILNLKEATNDKNPFDKIKNVFENFRNLTDEKEIAKPIKPDNLFTFFTKIDKNLSIDFLPDLELPSPGLITIGARTGEGKTTAIINIARCALQQGKRVIMISLEESGYETLLKMMTCFAMHESILNKNKENLVPPFYKIISDIKQHGIKLLSLDNKDYKMLKLQYKHIKKLINDDKLIIYDNVKDINAVVKLIKKNNADVNLIDYLQIVPLPAQSQSSGYARIRDLINPLRTLRRDNCIVMGAQFNRMEGDNRKVMTDEEDHFTPEIRNFREGADIEQASDLALGIGWIRKELTDSKKFFYKILKSRGHGAQREKEFKTSCYTEHSYLIPKTKDNSDNNDENNNDNNDDDKNKKEGDVLKNLF